MSGTTTNSKQRTKGPTNATTLADPFGEAYSFRNLAMWQRAQELTDEVFGFIASLPNDRASGVLSQQILRSASSIAANIAEGHGRFAAGAYRNHLSIARGSAAETVSWLDLMKRRGLITPQQEHSALGKCAEVIKMVTAKMIDLDGRTNTSRALHDEREPYDAG